MIEKDNLLHIKNPVGPFKSAYIIIIIGGLILIILAIITSDTISEMLLGFILAILLFCVALPLNYKAQSSIPYELNITEKGIETKSKSKKYNMFISWDRVITISPSIFYKDIFNFWYNLDKSRKGAFSITKDVAEKIQEELSKFNKNRGV